MTIVSNKKLEENNSRIAVPTAGTAPTDIKNNDGGRLLRLAANTTSNNNVTTTVFSSALNTSSSSQLASSYWYWIGIGNNQTTGGITWWPYLSSIRS